MKPTQASFATATFTFTLAALAASLVLAVPVAGCSSSSSDGRSNGDPSSEDALAVKHCGGFAGLACSAGYVCVDDPSDSCDPAHGGADCIGICQRPSAPDGGAGDGDGGGGSDASAPTSCGGFTNIQCASGQTCVDDPRDNCDPAQGGADCPGICQASPPTSYTSCGGFTNVPCPSGQTCVDDPRDNCDPPHGGADCPGVCQ